MHEIAQGRVWIGTDAKRLNLVDELGGYDVAVKAAATLAKLPEGYTVERVEPALSLAEQLALQLRIRVARLAGSLLGPSLGAVKSQLAPLAGLTSEFDRLRQQLSSRALVAHCFCRVE